MSAQFSQAKLPLAYRIEQKSYGARRVQEEDKACTIKVVDVAKLRCGCPGVGGQRLDVVDENLGHALLFGGGYGHTVGAHFQSLGRFVFFNSVLRFVEETHIYYYRHAPPFFDAERQIKASTTAVISRCFAKFDAPSVVQAMRARGRMDDPRDEYYGLSDEQVMQQWVDNGAEKSGIGSEMHAACERYLTNARLPDDPHEATRQFALFLEWHIECMVLANEIPFFPEICMCDEEHEMAGMADLTSQPLEWAADPARCHWINLKDWKCTDKVNWDRLPYRNDAERTQRDVRRIFYAAGAGQLIWQPKKRRGYAAKRALGVAAALIDCDASKYCLQLNVYKWMIERNSPYVVKSMQIVAFHWTNDEPVVIDVPDLQDIVRALMAQRRRELIAEYEADILLAQTRLASLQTPRTGPNGSLTQQDANSAAVHQKPNKKRSFMDLFQ